MVVEQLPPGNATFGNRLRELAAADNAHLQPILDLDRDSGLVVFGFVEGLPLVEAAPGPRPLPEAARIAADVAYALVDHPGPLRPQRILLVGGRAVVALAGSEALRAGAPPPSDVRPFVGRILGWMATGRDPGEGEAPLVAFGATPPTDAAGLAAFLEGALVPQAAESD